MVIGESDHDTKVAIVILNYQNSQDSLACVSSIRKQNYPELAGILVVDNGSSDDNFDILKNKLREDNQMFHLIRLHKNLGFARGNNVGIHYARRRWNTDYILVVNNDTLFTDSDMLSKLLLRVREDTAMLGPAIRLPNGYIQKEYQCVTEFPGLFYKHLFFCAKSLHLSSLDMWLVEKWNRREYHRKTLHGCAMLFTPMFFRYYEGIYSKTFLYCEELILSFQIHKVGLKQCYVPDTEIFHLEDQSTNMAFKNVEKSKLQYLRQSYRHAVIAKILPYNVLKKMC